MLLLKQNLQRKYYYEKEIEKLGQKVFAMNKSFHSCSSEIAFSQISRDRRFISKNFIKELKKTRYTPEAGTTYTVVVNEKVRELFKFNYPERIIHGTVAAILTEILDPLYSDRLFSYRPEKSFQDAMKQFSVYIRNHLNKVSDIKKRGLYVLRQDIENYTDSIPVWEGAPVWTLLQKTLTPDLKDPFEAYLWNLLQSLVRPQIKGETGLYTKQIGVPTGSPISAVLYNLCGTELDKVCSKVQGAFYARYSDDFIFAHHDPEIVKTMQAEISACLNGQGLKINPEKSKILYFNGAARPSEIWQDACGTASVEFLGAQINFKGEIALSSKRTRKLLTNIRARALRTSKLADTLSETNKPALVCKIVNDALAENDEDAGVRKSFEFIINNTTNRSYLRQLDYLLSLMVSESISGLRGPRSFKMISPKFLRQKCGLSSLFHKRNLYGKGV
jgi:hypothetical protein